MTEQYYFSSIIEKKNLQCVKHCCKTWVNINFSMSNRIRHEQACFSAGKIPIEHVAHLCVVFIAKR